jgi:hypothetical protein
MRQILILLQRFTLESLKAIKKGDYFIKKSNYLII